MVIKIGGSLLLKKDTPDISFLKSLVDSVAQLIKDGRKVTLVSSGAIALGKASIGGKIAFGKGIPSRQALASVGQIKLMNLYCEFFKDYSLQVGQILLSASDFSHHSTYINARNTILALLKAGAVPIVNENDTVAVEEIKFGDNDTLSALVAALVDADLLVILSDIKGLYTSDPKKDPQARFLSLVERIDRRVEEMAEGTCVEGRVGGMRTKIEAAKIATRSGIPVVIGGGNNFLKALFFEFKQEGTLFLPTQTKLQARKRWIAYGRKPKGSIVVDEGAKRALLEKGGSLLPVGIKEIKGKFQSGDSVSILDSEGKEFARGIVYYSSEELKRIKGLHTNQIEEKLGYCYYEEAIHRDNLVIL